MSTTAFRTSCESFLQLLNPNLRVVLKNTNLAVDFRNESNLLENIPCNFVTAS